MVIGLKSCLSFIFRIYVFQPSAKTAFFPLLEKYCRRSRKPEY